MQRLSLKKSIRKKSTQISLKKPMHKPSQSKVSNVDGGCKTSATRDQCDRIRGQVVNRQSVIVMNCSNDNNSARSATVDSIKRSRSVDEDNNIILISDDEDEGNVKENVNEIKKQRIDNIHN